LMAAMEAARAVGTGGIRTESNESCSSESWSSVCWEGRKTAALGLGSRLAAAPGEDLEWLMAGATRGDREGAGGSSAEGRLMVMGFETGREKWAGLLMGDVREAAAG
jgi:hypothetical protein